MGLVRRGCSRARVCGVGRYLRYGVAFARLLDEGIGRWDMEKLLGGRGVEI